MLDVVESQVSRILPYTFENLEDGFKYLRYFLKPSFYYTCDRFGIINELEKKMTHWCHRWLTSSGRNILLKTNLESTLMYWLYLARLQKRIIKNIIRIYNRFAWSCSKNKL